MPASSDEGRQDSANSKVALPCDIPIWSLKCSNMTS